MSDEYRSDDKGVETCKKYGMRKKAMRHFSPLKGWVVLGLALIAVVTCIWLFTHARASEAGQRPAEVAMLQGSGDGAPEAWDWQGCAANVCASAGRG